MQKNCTAPRASVVFVASPLHMNTSRSPPSNFLMIFVLLRQVAACPMVSSATTLANPHTNTFCSGAYMVAASLTAKAFAASPCWTLTIAHTKFPGAVPAPVTADISQRRPVTVQGKVAVNKVVVCWVAEMAVLLITMMFLSIGRLLRRAGVVTIMASPVLWRFVEDIVYV